MTASRRARDLELLDAVDVLPRVAVNDTVWRVVLADRHPLQCYASAGRWDPGHFDVLYTSFDQDGAVAEMYFHLSRQPVFPSRSAFVVHEIEVTTRSTLRFNSVHDLEPLGIDPERYLHPLYERTQQIGDAAAFLGFDGIVAPSARWKCLNLVLFCDAITPEDLAPKASSAIDWDDWRSKNEASVRIG